MIQNKNIIIIYGPPWDQPAQLSKHHFARLWSKENRVLYIEAPINPFSFITRKKEARYLWKKYKNGYQKVSDSLWVTTFFYLLPFRGNKYLFGGKWINWINQYFVKNKLKQQLEDLGFNNPILVVGSAHIYPIVDAFNAEKIIYHCSDDYTLVPSFPKSFKEIEKNLMKVCDLVITTADELKKAKEHMNANIVSIPNGVNVHHFKLTQNIRTMIHEDIKQIPKPIIGYIGTVFRWIDQDWIEYAAKEHKDYNFIFIGPVTTDISKLQKLRNVFFLGPKPYDSLPSFLKAFSVAIIPFVIDGVTLKASPIKFYEYLASGIPIISTDLPDLKYFYDVVSLVNNKEDFCNQIKITIENDNNSLMLKRMKLAESYSWEKRFNQLNKYIESI